MKKKTYLKLLFLTLLLASCANKTEELNILTPTGAPAFAFYNYVGQENFETNSVPKNIVSMMNESSTKDVIVIDTVSGIQAIQKTNAFKLAATITFGNFYIASTGNDENNTLDQDDKIILFGEKQTPDYIFHLLYGDQFDTNIEWVTAASDAAKCLITKTNPVTKNKVDYVFLAEPALHNALEKNKDASIYENIQDSYYKKVGTNIIQASVFIKNSLNKITANNFLNSLEKEINSALKNPSIIEEKLNLISEEEQKSIFGSTGKIVSEITKENNGLGLGYKKAINNKEAIKNFLSLFNIYEIGEEIFYK